jgi:Protein of unknown function (DUF3810)
VQRHVFVCNEEVVRARRSRLVRLAIIGLAVAAALAPLSPDAVEQFYSLGIYPRLQRLITACSNLTGFAWFDVFVGLVVVSWVVLAWRDLRERRWLRGASRIVVRTVTLAAALYLFFLAAWGLNYRRVTIEDKVGVDYRAVTSDAAVALAEAAAHELNRLYPSRSTNTSLGDGLDLSLSTAFASVQATLGQSTLAVPGRPKRTLFDFYFRAASVDGMTDPFFLETMTLAGLLPVERHMTVAHEWAHLAGYADEGEANFVGWLVCLNAGDAARYSGWLFLYGELLSGLDRDTRGRVSAILDPGPRADLAAIAARVRSQASPAVVTVGWGVYDQYLKANGVERGTRSYTDVVRLVLGTPLGRAATPGRPGAAPQDATSPARP